MRSRIEALFLVPFNLLGFEDTRIANIIWRIQTPVEFHICAVSRGDESEELARHRYIHIHSFISKTL